MGGGVPLAARENDGQRRGTIGWLLEQKSQSKGMILGIKIEEEEAALVWEKNRGSGAG